MENSHDIAVAACAILMEMAGIDGEFDPSEISLIMETLKKSFDLSGERAKVVMASSSQELSENRDLWRFTNQINQNYSRDEKLEVLRTIFRVVYADDSLSKHEDYLVRKLTYLFRLTHKDMINAKLAVRDGS